MRLFLVATVAAVVASTSAEAASCKSYRTCAQAVKAWCEGRHNGADRDDDKIPCENVCKSRKQSREEARKIGCKKAD